MAQTLERIEEKLLSADEFMALPLDNVELVRGRLVQLMPPLFGHGLWASNIIQSLGPWARRNGLGLVTADVSFRLSQNPDVVRVPDVCFIALDQIEGQDFDSYIEGAPTIAVEIKSKNETLDSLLDKAAEYLQAGSQQVWIVQPGRRRVLVLSQDESEVTFRVGESIPGGDALPGLNLPVADVFETL